MGAVRRIGAVAALALLPFAAPADAGVDGIGVGECTASTRLTWRASCTMVADSSVLVVECRGVGGGTGHYSVSIPGQPPGEPQPCEAGGVIYLSLVPQPLATLTVEQANATGYLVGTVS